MNLVGVSKKSAEKPKKFLGKISQKPSMNEDGESEEQIRDFNISKHNSLINKGRLVGEVVDYDANSDSMAAVGEQETHKSEQTSGKLEADELSLNLDFIQCEPFEDQKIPSGQKNGIGDDQLSEVDTNSEVIYLSDDEAVIIDQEISLLDDQLWTRAKPRKKKYPKNGRKRANSEGISRKPKKTIEASTPAPKPIFQNFQSQILRKKPFIDYNRTSEYYKMAVASDFHHWKSKHTPSNNSGITKIAGKYSSKDPVAKVQERVQKKRLKSDQIKERRRLYEKMYRQRLKLTDGYKEKQRAKQDKKKSVEENVISVKRRRIFEKKYRDKLNMDPVRLMKYKERKQKNMREYNERLRAKRQVKTGGNSCEGLKEKYEINDADSIVAGARSDINFDIGRLGQASRVNGVCEGKGDLAFLKKDFLVRQQEIEENSRESNNFGEEKFDKKPQNKIEYLKKYRTRQKNSMKIDIQSVPDLAENP